MAQGRLRFAVLSGWLVFALTGAAQAQMGAGEALRADLQRSYPSLAYVDLYRRTYPQEVEGGDDAWTVQRPAPRLAGAEDLVAALVGLADQHVALDGPRAGSPETLGVLFRTSTDGHMVVWRIFDPAARAVGVGDEVVSIDGRPTGDWLRRAARTTFGGNRRSRQAEAGLNLGMGTRIAHQTAGLGAGVDLVVRAAEGGPRAVRLSYRPMDEAQAAAMTAALNQGDLPDDLVLDGRRVGVVRLGAFAPQYDAAFKTAADAAAKASADDDQAMLAGFCAVTREVMAGFDAAAARSDLMVVDLRGNLGGFGREARLLAWAMTGRKPPRTLDVFASGKPGVLRLAAEPDDPPCGLARVARPIVVLTDAGDRSAGELMAAWMWASGALVIGERTIGAGGGYEFGSHGFALAETGFNVRVSGNFTVFDPGGRLGEGEMAERAWVDQVGADGFAPSRTRPFAIQAVGLAPDIAVATTLADLRDGGQAALGRGLAAARARGWVP